MIQETKPLLETFIDTEILVAVALYLIGSDILGKDENSTGLYLAANNFRKFSLFGHEMTFGHGAITDRSQALICERHGSLQLIQIDKIPSHLLNFKDLEEK